MAPASSWPPKAWPSIPTGSLFVSDTVDNRLERFSGSRRLPRPVGRRGWSLQLLQRPGRNRRGPPRSRVRGRPRQRPPGPYLGRRDLPQRTRRAAADGRRPAVLARIGRGRPGQRQRLRRRHAPQPRARVRARRLAARRAGGRAKATAPPAADRDSSSSPTQSPSARGGEVFVADTGNDRVVALSPAGAVQATWGGRGMANGHLRTPDGIAVDAAGRVFVADRENNRVQEFSSTGTFLAKWGGRGVGPGRIRPADGDRRRLHRSRLRRRHPQQPRPELHPALPGRRRMRARERLAAAARRGPRAAPQPRPRERTPLATGAGADGGLPAGLQDPRQRQGGATGPPRPAPGVGGKAAARRPDGARATARRAPHAAAPAPRARSHAGA